MVQIIRSKKSNCVSIVLFCLCAFASGRNDAAFAAGTTQGTLPIIRNVGAIPVQAGTIETLQDLNASRRFIGENFGDAVRASKRFIIIDDDFVKAMWGSADGRQELAEEHELHGFVSLEIQLRDDTILWYCRLLSAKLETYLIESESMSRHQFGALSNDQLTSRLQELVFRMLNRLPIDTTITSIQGKYVTLSGGQEQGINNHDEFVIEDIRVATTHPATGAWLKFDRRVLGRVKVIEVKTNSAIAEVTQMTSNDSMNIGSGAKIPDLASRLKFKRMRPESPTAVTDAKLVPSTPIYDVQPGQKTFEPKVGDESNVPTRFAASPVESEDNPETGSGESTGMLDTLDQLIDYGSIDGGFRFWKVSGVASAEAGAFPINFIQASGGRKFIEETIIEASGHFGFGTTKKGGFQSFGGSGRLIFGRPIDESISWFVAGGGGLTSLAVTDESFGGYDFIYAGGSGGVNGKTVMGEHSLAWTGEIELRPFHLGEIGAKGDKKSVESSLLTTFRFKLYQEIAPKNLEWGGVLESTSGTHSLSSSDLKYSDLTLLASGRIRF